MRGLLYSIGRLGRAWGRGRDDGKLLFHGLANLGVGQAAGKPVAHGLANALPGRVLLSYPANHGGIRGDFHAAGRVSGNNAVEFQVGVGAGHHLGIRQQLLRERPVFRQTGTRLERARGYVRHDLTRDLLVNGHGGIVLDVVQAHALEANAWGGEIQPILACEGSARPRSWVFRNFLRRRASNPAEQPR
jgi:hypothetical protein